MIRVIKVSEHGHGDSTDYYTLSPGPYCSLSQHQMQWLADRINGGDIALPDDPHPIVRDAKDKYDEAVANAKTVDERMRAIFSKYTAKRMNEIISDLINKRITNGY